MWDSYTGKQLCELPIPFVYWGNSIEFSKDGTLIISANQNKNAIIWKWDAETNHAVFLSTLEGHNEKVIHASFSNDGRLAVTASPHKIIVWNVSTSTIMKEIKHSDEKMFVCFTPDSKNIIYLSASDAVTSTPVIAPIQELIDQTRKKFKN